MDKPEAERLTDQEKVEELEFGETIAPFANLKDASLPVELESNPYLVPNFGVITFKVSLEPFEDLDTKQHFANPREITLEVDLSPRFSASQKFAWHKRLGVGTTANGRDLWGIPELDQESGRLIFNKWAAITTKEFNYSPQVRQKANPLIVDAEDIPQLKFKIKELRDIAIPRVS